MNRSSRRKPAEELAAALVASDPMTVAEWVIEQQIAAIQLLRASSAHDSGVDPDAPNPEDVAETDQVRLAALEAIERLEDGARQA